MTVFFENANFPTSKKKIRDEEDVIVDIQMGWPNFSTSKKKIYDEEDVIVDIPIGWRFVPTEEELIVSYLSSKVALRPLPAPIIKEVDAVEFYRHHPKNLVGTACLPSFESESESELYLFIHHDEYFHGKITRMKPVGEDIGYWKCNGKEEAILDVNGNVFACKIQYTFFAKGRKTHWKMDEYRLLNTSINELDENLPRGEWVVAKIKGA